MYATPCSSASCATSLSTLKPMRLPANAGVSAHSTTTRSSVASRICFTAAMTSGSVPGCGISSQPRMIVGGLNRWMPRKLRRKSSDWPAHIADDRQARRDRRDDRALARGRGRRARTPRAWSRGPRRRTRRSGRPRRRPLQGRCRRCRPRSTSRATLPFDICSALRAAGFCLLERTREHRGGDAGGGEYSCRARTHRTIGPEDDDLPNGSHWEPFHSKRRTARSV